jgi:hypothetical protein
MQPTYGVVEGMPAEEYHGHPFVSNSSIKPCLEGDWETYHALNVADPKPCWAKPIEETPAMKRGTAFHALLLENIEPVVAMPCEARLARGKREGELCGNASSHRMEDAWFCGIHAKGPKFIEIDSVFSREDRDAMLYARDRVLADPEIAPYLETRGRAEVSIFWQDAETGLDCRCRVDRLCDFSDGLCIFDLKFGSANPNEAVDVGYKVADMGYLTQSAMYFDAVEAECSVMVREFVFCFVRNSPPYDCGLWQVAPVDLELGRSIYREALREVRDRRISNNWRNAAFGQRNIVSMPRRLVESRPVQRFTEFDMFQGLSQ